MFDCQFSMLTGIPVKGVSNFTGKPSLGVAMVIGIALSDCFNSTVMLSTPETDTRHGFLLPPHSGSFVLIFHAMTDSAPAMTVATAFIYKFDARFPSNLAIALPPVAVCKKNDIVSQTSTGWPKNVTTIAMHRVVMPFLGEESVLLQRMPRLPKIASTWTPPGQWPAWPVRWAPRI